jgi:hypothetical protein
VNKIYYLTKEYMNRVAKTEQLTQAVSRETESLCSKEFTNTFALAEEIDPNNLPEHFALIIVAARRMGSTHYLKHLLHQLHKGKRTFDAVFVFSETAALQPDNFYYAPPAFIRLF